MEGWTDGWIDGWKEGIPARQCIANMDSQVLTVGKTLAQDKGPGTVYSSRRQPTQESMLGSPHDPSHASSLLHHQKLMSNLPSKGFGLFLSSKSFQEVLDVKFSAPIVVPGLM